VSRKVRLGCRDLVGTIVAVHFGVCTLLSPASIAEPASRRLFPAPPLPALTSPLSRNSGKRGKIEKKPTFRTLGGRNLYLGEAYATMQMRRRTSRFAAENDFAIHGSDPTGRKPDVIRPKTVD
jgi:hypothetical protein